MTDALLLPLLPPILGLPPSLPALPLRPLSRFPPTLLAAVARHRMPWSKRPSASLQQTLSASRLPRWQPPALLVILSLIPLTRCSFLFGVLWRVGSRPAH